MPATRRTLLAVLLLPHAARAQGAAFPNRTVRIVVSFTAGGTTDIIARLVGQSLAVRWGQPVVIENRPGAGGNIGTEYVARATPDGHTLLVGSVGPLAVNQTLYRNPGYDTLRDLAPVTQIAGVPNVLVVAPSSTFRAVDDLIAAARARPGELSYGSTGVGTSSHLAAALTDQMRGVRTVHVPYRGAVALGDLLTGRLDFMYATIPSVIEHVRADRLRALAVTSLRRSRAMPGVMTMVEAGFEAFDASSWFGVVAPARTPPEIVEAIAREVDAIVRQPETERLMVDQGADPVGEGPAAFRAYIGSEIARWGTIVRASGAVAD